MDSLPPQPSSSSSSQQELSANEKVSMLLKKWSSLQKIIKEEITLEEISKSLLTLLPSLS